MIVVDPLPFPCDRDDVAALREMYELAARPFGALFIDRAKLQRADRIIRELDRLTPKGERR